MDPDPRGAPLFDVVKLAFGREPWYARITFEDGSTLHSEQWATEWAAQHCADLWRQHYYEDMVKRGHIGNGDVCPLFPEHGPMFALRTPPGSAPMQYCPNRKHDGGGLTDRAPRSRCLWPLYGFEEAVAAYFARLDKAIREADLPDLSDLEVK